jgi:hypothetical protein
MIGMQRNPDINITFLQSVSEPSAKIEVRETPDEILSIRATKVRFNRFGSLAIFAAIRRASSLVSSMVAMSALPPKADIGTQPRDVRFVPKADILRRSKTAAIRSPRRRY